MTKSLIWFIFILKENATQVPNTNLVDVLYYVEK